MKAKRALILGAAAALATGGSEAWAGSLTVYGGPTLDQVSGIGFRNPVVPFQYGVNASGEAVAHGHMAGGDRAVRWDASGAEPVELGNLGILGMGSTATGVAAINAIGTSVGFADKGSNVYLGTRAVRWDAGGIATTELGNLGTDDLGFTLALANAINAGGAVVGESLKYNGNTSLGFRAVRWDAGGTAITELGNLGTDASGRTQANALGVNGNGTVVGYADKASGAGGRVAVRWDASGTVATELGGLGTDASGSTTVQALAINADGTVIGDASKYSGGTFLGVRGVRWNAHSTAATELSVLGRIPFG